MLNQSIGRSAVALAGVLRAVEISWAWILNVADFELTTRGGVLKISYQERSGVAIDRRININETLAVE